MSEPDPPLSPNASSDEVELHVPSFMDGGVDEEFTDNREPSSMSPFVMIALALSVMLGGSLNNVLGKVKSKPLGTCNFFASVSNPLIYAALYLAIVVSIIFRIERLAMFIGIELLALADTSPSSEDH